ncbi:VOC family protein [Brasilonema sp. UFV-L1]|uniref:VOC family protein n=1 Tax=Brasilonema sp. UFV-L1 TaxID=2234130 RepID=UPI0030D74031
MTLPKGSLRRIHHISLKVSDMRVSRHFYGGILGLHELTGDALPEPIRKLIEAEKIAIFYVPDGSLLNLFWEPDLPLNNTESHHGFTHAEISNHLAFEINSQLFEQAIEVLRANQIKFDYGIDGPTGQAIYCYDPDRLLIEIRHDYLQPPKPTYLT